MTPPATQRVRQLETAQQTLSASVFTLNSRVEDVRDAVANLDAKLDRLDEKLDAASVSRATSTGAAEAATKALELRLASMEGTRTEVLSAGRWAVTRLAPIFLAMIAASQLSDPVKAALSAIFAPH